MSESKKVNLFFLYMLCFYIIISLAILPLFSKQLAGNINIQLIISQGLIAIPCFAYCLLTKGKAFDNIETEPIGIKVILLLACFTITMMPVISFVNALSMMFVENHVAANLSGICNNPLWYSILLMAVLPALVEEFAFRGIIYNGYKKSGNIKGAVFLTSLLFGCFHMNFNQFLYAFVMSIFMVLIYEATDSIFSTITIHALFNGFSTYMQYVQIRVMRDIEQKAQESEEYRKLSQRLNESRENAAYSYVNDTLQEKLSVLIPLFIIGAIALVLSIILLRQIAKLCNRTDKLKQIVSFKKIEGDAHTTNAKLYDLPLFLGIGICILFMIRAM